MTIEQFIKHFKTEIDQIWVKDENGNIIENGVPGFIRFTNVVVDYYNNGSFADLTFTV